MSRVGWKVGKVGFVVVGGDCSGHGCNDAVLYLVSSGGSGRQGGIKLGRGGVLVVVVVLVGCVERFA